MNTEQAQFFQAGSDSMEAHITAILQNTADEITDEHTLPLKLVTKAILEELINRTLKKIHEAE
jgi:hypothetical protein